jgi:hypothetical protein
MVNNIFYCRLKMGLCTGRPRFITPDHLGRADYHGSSINLAARFMDAGKHCSRWHVVSLCLTAKPTSFSYAASHGGQIAMEKSLFKQLYGQRERLKLTVSEESRLPFASNAGTCRTEFEGLTVPALHCESNSCGPAHHSSLSRPQLATWNEQEEFHQTGTEGLEFSQSILVMDGDDAQGHLEISGGSPAEIVLEMGPSISDSTVHSDAKQERKKAFPRPASSSLLLPNASDEFLPEAVAPGEMSTVTATHIGSFR